MIYRFIAFAVLGCIAIPIGCSREPRPVDMGGEEGSKIAGLIEELNEAKHNSKKVVNFFLAKPKTTKELNQHNYYVVGKPEVKGNSATCKVLVERTDGTPIGERSWTFEKVSSDWKIKDLTIQ